MESNKELEEFLVTATAETVRGSLRDQGIAWSIMRSEGRYTGNTKFLPSIETDLLEYGLSLLRASLQLKKNGGNSKLYLKGFEIAGRSFESLITNAGSDNPDTGFFQIIAACCYHLAEYSAIAFSILNNQIPQNITTAEQALGFLILRNLSALRNHVSAVMAGQDADDTHLAELINNDELSTDDAIAKISNLSICRALAYFEFALQTGEKDNLDFASDLLNTVIRLSGTTGFVTQWWIATLCLQLIDDLWEHSLHNNIPIDPPSGGAANYSDLRKRFIFTLYKKDVAEVELWPSQIEAAQRSTNIEDDLIVALPTSAGKTRIAELAALMTLSTEKRIFIVTPLRALSAQTERSFRSTFSPLGYTVSSLYGAIGMSTVDRDTLKDKNIVIATPEKLDFALRNDPSLLNDVGLIVLDEGHMIGPTEREIRYEILVQKLLRRNDAKQRRIVCLSAILPEGKQLDNFTNWIRDDEEGTAIRFPWRPTRQRFGTLIWQGNNATLNFDYRSDIPFINRFLEEIKPLGRDKNPRPQSLNEKSIFAAWKFASQEKRVLIFVTQANWVESFGANALKLVEKGYLTSLLEEKNSVEIAHAISVGKEWLGQSHPAVKALEIGMVIHHGNLPNPFLREIELLLSKGIIKVTVASPTLSQGLNINAAVLIVPYLYRAGSLISGEEFANVAGRAGRAYVDMEGFVVHIISDNIAFRKKDWRLLISSARERNLSSGLFQVIEKIYKKLSEKSKIENAYEYLASQRTAWFPAEQEEENADEEIDKMDFLLEKLDAMVLGLIEALESDSDDLAELLDSALRGSLWDREVSRMSTNIKKIHLEILTARAELIWSNTTVLQRQGHYAMGVGFDTGLELDKNFPHLSSVLELADEAAAVGNVTDLSVHLIELAELLLTLRPFKPLKPLHGNWKAILKQWISGQEIERIGEESIPLIEDIFSYRLIWALEALRMKRISMGWIPKKLSGGAAACLENGVPDFMMAMLIRAGLPSRTASIKAVKDGKGRFDDPIWMFNWLSSKNIRELSKKPDWPTAETHDTWIRFREQFFKTTEKVWNIETKRLKYDPLKFPSILPGHYRIKLVRNLAHFFTPDFKRAFSVKIPYREELPGLINAKVSGTKNKIYLERFGPGEFFTG